MRSGWARNTLLPAFNAVVSIVVPLGVFVYFARTIAPAQLGVIAFATACLEVLKAISPLGVYEALLVTDNYEAQVRPASAMLAVSAVAGLIIYAVIMVAAPLWIGPDAKALLLPLLVLGLKFVTDVMITQPLATLARRKDYSRLAIRVIVSNIAGAVIGLAVGVLISPLWGLVVYYASQSFINWLGTVAFTGALAPFSRQWGALADISRLTWLSTQVRALGTMNNFVDQIILSAFVPTAQAALFSVGKRVEQAQISASQSFISTLFQPMFARRVEAELAVDYRRAMAAMALIFGAPAAVLIINAASVVTFVFGDKWTAAGPLVAALTLSGYSRVVANVQGAFFSVGGKNAMLRNRSLASLALTVAIMLMTGWIGVFVVGWLLAAKNIALTVWSCGPARHLAGIKFMAGAILGSFLAALGGAWLGGEAAQLMGLHTGALVPMFGLWVISGVAGVVAGGLVLAGAMKTLRS